MSEALNFFHNLRTLDTTHLTSTRIFPRVDRNAIVRRYLRYRVQSQKSRNSRDRRSETREAGRRRRGKSSVAARNLQATSPLHTYRHSYV